MLMIKIIASVALLIILYIYGKKFHYYIDKKYDIHLVEVGIVIMFGYFIAWIGTLFKQPYGEHPEKILILLKELKIIETISMINTASLVLYIISLGIILLVGYAMIKSFGFWIGLPAFLIMIGISWFALGLMVFLFFLAIFVGGIGASSSRTESRGNTSSDNNLPYAPYQGDKSIAGGVVGGSITHPVGGRAGQ